MKLQLLKKKQKVTKVTVDNPWHWLDSAIVGSEEIRFDGDIFTFLVETFELIDGNQFEDSADNKILLSMYPYFGLEAPNLKSTSNYRFCSDEENKNEDIKTTLIFGAGSNNLDLEENKYVISNMGHFKAKDWLYVTVDTEEDSFKYYIVLKSGKRFLDKKKPPKTSVHFKDLISLEEKFLGGSYQKFYDEYKEKNISVKDFIENHKGTGSLK